MPGPLILAAGSMLDQPPEVLIDAAAGAGFDGVGLRLSAEHAGDPVRLGRRAHDLGIVIHDVEVYRISTEATSPEPLLDAAAAAGAAAVLVVSDHPDPAVTMSALHALTAECLVRNLRLAIEYMAWTTPSRPGEAVSIADEVGCELIVDVLHHVRVGAGPAELADVVASGRLGWVQLCDAPLAPPRGPIPDSLVTEARHGRLAPGLGELPLVALGRELPTDTPISVEVQSDDLLAMAPPARAQLLHDRARAVVAAW